MNDTLASLWEELQDETFACASGATLTAIPQDRRLDGARIQQFLEERGLAAIATVRENGLPHLTMSYFVLGDGDFWLPNLAGTLRSRNVLATPYASLLIAEGQGPSHTMVKVEGEAEVYEQAPPEVMLSHITKLSTGVDWVECWIRVEPFKLYSYAAPDSRMWAAEAAEE